MRRPERYHGVVKFCHGLGNESVEAPAPLTPVGHQPGLAEDPEVKGEAGLCSIEISDQITDAALPVPQRLDDLEASLIGESVGQGRGTLPTGGERGGHGPTLINIF